MDPQQGPPQPDLLIGQTIGNYLVTQKLGEGGMGAVYLAEHPSIGKKVALKVLHSEFSTNQEVTARFFHEAKAVNDIGHPNIVDIVDFGILQAQGGREQLVYFIMEYLAGATLSQLIKSESPLPPERALSIALQVADALSASHKCGIVHRDLKPDNVILLQRGRERDFVKLLDFGIAKLTGGSATGSQRTRTGIVMGTPAYMSPEQCEGRMTVDLRTDVYALGIVLYEMLTGRVPFIGEGYGEILVQHLTQRPTPPSSYRMLPAHVEVVVLKALEKRPDLRYPTMEEFMRALADPVGYVESHGGVSGFLQRQLMPSNAPLPSIRLTPAPLTPPPGTLLAPGMSASGMSGPGMSGPLPRMSGPLPSLAAAPTVAMSASPSNPGMLAPGPAAQGTGAGSPGISRNTAIYLAAGALIGVAAVAALVGLVGKDKINLPATGSAAIVDDHAGAGGDTASIGDPGGTPPAGGTAAGGTAAGGTVSAGTATGGTGASGGTTSVAAGGSGAMAGSNAAGVAAQADGTGTAGQAGSAASAPGASDGSAVAHTGAGTSHGASPGDDVNGNSEISVTSSPSGARVFVDNVDTGKITPTKLEIPKKSDKPISITLRLKGYEPFTFKAVDVRESSQQVADLVKTRAAGSGAPAAKCRTAERAGCPRDSKGCCVPAGGRNASDDPDGLLRPDSP